MFDLPPLMQLTERRQLRFHDVTRVGDDLRILARFAEAASPSSATPNKE
jgi:diaminohydroxyphosphoribosylaminopyrimidine deaminase/5-amino-6-(5-phosphoribosylamino)uracil reductase